MIRKQVYITKEQEAALKRLARTHGVTEAELIRSCLDRGLAAVPVLQRDPSALEEFLAFARERQASGSLPGGRTWTREDLYEDRLRWPR